MLDKILVSCQYVMDHAEHVQICYDKLNDFIQTIELEKLNPWLSNNPYDLFSLDIEMLINFMLLYESINYSFWGNPKWTINTEEGLKDGSDALLYCLLSYVKKTKSTDFSKMKLTEFQEIVKGNITIPLLEQRYDTLVENSKIINTKMRGNFYQYIFNVVDDRELFSIIIENFPSFQDKRDYHGQEIYFYKLAQLLVNDILYFRKRLENIEVDCSHLLGCADYKIPQTLRALGIIKYDYELTNLVDNKQELAISSDYEIEIRASVLVTIQYIKKQLPSAYLININDYLYGFSKNVKNMVKPYHLCRNTNY